MKKTATGLEVTLVTKDLEKNGEETSTISEVDCLLWAIGREPNIEGLNLEKLVRTTVNKQECFWDPE